MLASATGHRSNKLGGYNNAAAETRLYNVAVETMKPYVDKVTEIHIGMAQGWDQTLAKACLALGIPVVANIPCIGQEKMWPAQAQREYAELLGEIKAKGGRIEAANVPYSSKAMMDRNKAMIDAGGDLLVACWNGDPSGGTANAIQYARAKGVPIINCYYDVFPPVKVSTSNFWANVDGCKVAISRTKPETFLGKSIPKLAPTAFLLKEYKEGRLDWAGYVEKYRSDLDSRLKDFPGVDTRDRLAYLLKRAGEELGSGHLVLCCWEKEGNNCHRYIVADLLPKSMLKEVR